MPKPLEFWFEFASTYSYPATMRVEDACRAAGVPLIWRPFLLGPVFAAQGLTDSPFNLYPVKGQYMWRDLERRCDTLGLPFRKPTGFPRGSMLAARIACAHDDADWVGDFIRAVYTANFAEDRDISATPVIAAVLDTLSLDADTVIAAATTPESKEKLKHQTSQAVKLGIFGAPSFWIDGELFWGQDRLEEAIAWAG